MPSAVIRQIDYDPDARRMTVRFVSGASYQYYAVPERVAAAFRGAGSKGRYFMDHIRDRYPYEKLH